MSDLISRQAALDIASGYCHPANIAKELADLPSAQPERKNRRKLIMLASETRNLMINGTDLLVNDVDKEIYSAAMKGRTGLRYEFHDLTSEDIVEFIIEILKDDGYIVRRESNANAIWVHWVNCADAERR